MAMIRCYGCMEPINLGPFCPHCGYDQRNGNAPHQLPIGTVLQGKYLVGKALGQGGFGITYLGWDQILEIPVAIKEYYPSGVVSRDSAVSTQVLLTRGDNGEYAENRARFLREAQTLAKLEAVPEVVQVKNFFLENGTAYIIMGYVRGITLQRYIQQLGGRLSVEETFAILGPVIRAMERVHKIGLVHRDISPDNIMLQPGGQPRLIDFGAAHKSSLESDMKSTQAVLKYGFAPMEQYQRKGNLGPWTDVYAICATAYYCLTGKTPPHATDRIMGEDDFDWNIPGLQPHQRHAMEKGVVLHVNGRTQSMAELEQALFGAPVAPAVVAAPVYRAAPVYQQASIPEAPSPAYTVPLVREQEQSAYTAPVRQAKEQEVTPPQPRFVQPYPQPWNIQPGPKPSSGGTVPGTSGSVDLQTLIDRPMPQQKPRDYAAEPRKESFWNKPKSVGSGSTGSSLEDLINNPVPWKTSISQPEPQPKPEPVRRDPNAPKPDLQSLIDNPNAYNTGKKRW